MTTDRRKPDPRIDSIVETVEKIFNILKGKNGDPGLCEDVRNNTKDIKHLKGKPTKIKSLVIFILLGVNTIVAILALASKASV